MDVVIVHNHIPSHTHPWRWEMAPGVVPPPPSVPRSCAGFKQAEDAEQDAKAAGHVVVGVRE